MNRGVLQSSPVQQMMAAGNPSWWNINNLMRPPPLVSSSSISSSSSSSSHQHHHQISPSSSTSNFMAPPPLNTNDMLQAPYNMNMSSTNSSSSWIDDNHAQEQQFPESWSQLLFGGVFMGEEARKMGSWEEQVMLLHHHQQQSTFTDQVKQESSVDSHNNNNQESHLVPPKAWPPQPYPQMNIIPTSSPQSCVSTFSSNNNNNNNSNSNNNNNSNNNSILEFSSPKSSDNNLHAGHLDRSSECNRAATGGALKKAKVQPSSSQSTGTFKVRKEKLGDRITALHQLVSPFGKTDTASVLLEAIGYIRFLQSQIQALSLPYLNSGAGNKRQPHPESYEEPKDLRSRGLCLVPVSCTLHVGSDNGADYWAPALGGGFR